MVVSWGGIEQISRRLVPAGTVPFCGRKFFHAAAIFFQAPH